MSETAAGLVSCPVSGLHGDIAVPGDKSISHRALMLGAIAQGRTEIRGFLNSLDCLATLQALRQLGVAIKHADSGLITITGQGLYGLKASSQKLDFGNSGTAVRLMTGLLCAQKFPSLLSGDESLRRRPMRRVVEPLTQMGADIHTGTDGRPPIKTFPVSGLSAIKYRLPIASAQLKSCLLFAALYAQGTTVLTGEIHTRDHTEKMLAAFGCGIEADAERISLDGGVVPQATSLDVPGDISSAAFFIVAASIVPGSDLLIRNVGINQTRDGVLRILQAMGADLEVRNSRMSGDEAVADIRTRYTRLQGVNIPEPLVKNAIDEFPILFIAAACAEGRTELSGAEELRVKESDRIAAMAEGLKHCGVRVSAKPDGLVIEGGRGIDGGCAVNSYGDHRVAMAFAVAGAVARREIRIEDCANIQTSFPGFGKLAARAGFNLRAA